MKTMTREQIKKRLDNNEKIILVDALPEKYFTEGHLPGAINIPSDKVKSLASKMLADKKATIITYCGNATCTMSETAADVLEDLGYTNVFRYVEGMEDWKKAGFPVEKGACSTGDKKKMAGAAC